MPYPGCGGAVLPEGEVLARGALRAGPNSVERLLSERFELRRRDCLHVLTAHQEWPLNVADIEVVFDGAMVPLRAWKRMALPGARPRDPSPDIRRYELRGPEVVISRRVGTGPRTHEILRGGRPTAVLGPGRGLLTAWLRRARLSVGERTRELALDFRESIEVIRPVALRREADLFEPSYGRTVRVYTVYGRESVFADDDDVVIGDLAGLRPDALLRSARPPPLPLLGPPDPIGTP